MTEIKVWILAGVSGCGKSTFTNVLKSELNGKLNVCSTDSYIDDYCKENNIEMVFDIGGGKSQSSSDLLKPFTNYFEKRPWGNFENFSSSSNYLVKKIVINTDSQEAIKIAKDFGVGYHLRDPYYASSQCPNNEFWVHLAGNVGDHPTLMMVNAVSPLLEEDSIQQFVGAYKSRQRNMVTVNQKKKFVCDSATKRGINFDNSMAPNSQDLRPLAEITFGLCIATREEIIETKSIFGANPDFFPNDA